VAPSGPSGGFLPRCLEAGPLQRTIARKLPQLRQGGRPPTEAQRLEQLLTALEGQNGYDLLKLELDGSLFRNLDLMLGAGLVVYGEPDGGKVSMLDHARNCLQFFAKESCGKCVPCRLGCQQLVHIADGLTDRPPAAHELPQVRQDAQELAQVMRATSICGLGRVAANPFTSLLGHFEDDLTSLPPTGSPPV